MMGRVSVRLRADGRDSTVREELSLVLLLTFFFFLFSPLTPLPFSVPQSLAFQVFADLFVTCCPTNMRSENHR